MKKYTLFTIISLLTFFSTKAEKRRVLFIGNSYTYTNDLPNTLKQLALSLNDTLEVDSYALGGATFNTLANSPNTLAKLQLGNWDYVVLQGQSQEPAFPPVQVANDTYPYAKKLDSLVHVYNPCAETVFFMTWGRKNGDAANCAAYPPVCTYEGMQQRLRESYLEMTQDNHATCSPVGVAWRNVRNQFPAIELYSPDESHPAMNGTYLAACTFYSTIYQKSTVGATYIPVGMNATDASNIQTITSATVLDSIENWQQYGSLPLANFNFSNNQNNYTFTNLSNRATQYEWNFGDGSPLNNTQNPNHIYTASGTYTVTLKASDSCDKYSIKSKSFSVTVTPSGLQDINNTNNGILTYQNGYFNSMSDALEFKLFDINGSLLNNKKSIKANTHFYLGNLPSGIYFYHLMIKDKNILKGKVFVD